MKIKNLLNIPEDVILVTSDVVGLYPSIPQEASLNTFREAFGNCEKHSHR